MKPNWAVSGYQIARQSIALTLAVVLIPFATGTLSAQPQYAPLDPPALDQLVAPIALYPDSLVAQILTASTYPQQVSDANNWVHQTPGMPPPDRAAQADTMPWDPSVKALTAFPSVLDNLARNYNWTGSLGNAYYNQPGDVMNAIQAARVQAQQAGYLRDTPQQRVVYGDGVITIVPVNPALVYVPYYNPWTIYGGWVRPYAGFYVAPPPVGFAVGVGIGFLAAVSLGVFAHFAWGYHSWQPNWHGGVVVYNHNTYISRSTTVVNVGHFGEANRGVFERGGPGVPANFHPAVTRSTASFRAPNAAPGGFNRPAAPQARPGEFANRPAPQAQARPGSFAARPAPARAARPSFERPQAQPARPAAPAARSEAAPNRGEPHAAPARQAPQSRPADRGREEHEHNK